MYIIKTKPHGKCSVRYLRTCCFCIRNGANEGSERVRFLIRQQLVRKYRTRALAFKMYFFWHFLDDQIISSASYPDVSPMCSQRKAGRRQRARLPSVPFPWSLAVHQQSLAFRARLCHRREEDRTHKNSLKKVQNITNSPDLIDIWRVSNPDIKRFTCRRSKPEIHCRLDFFLDE